MHGTTRARPAAHTARNGINAVVWIEPARAIIVRGGSGEEGSTVHLELTLDGAGSVPSAASLAQVAHTVVDAEHVLILGPDDVRTALERELVAIAHHPEAIVEERSAGRIEEAELVARYRRLG